MDKKVILRRNFIFPIFCQLCNSFKISSVEIEKPFGIGTVDSHFASLSGIQSGVEYEFEVSTINCLGDISSSSKFSVTA